MRPGRRTGAVVAAWALTIGLVPLGASAAAGAGTVAATPTSSTPSTLRPALPAAVAPTSVRVRLKPAWRVATKRQVRLRDGVMTCKVVRLVRGRTGAARAVRVRCTVPESFVPTGPLPLTVRVRGVRGAKVRVAVTFPGAVGGSGTPGSGTGSGTPDPGTPIPDPTPGFPDPSDPGDPLPAPPVVTTTGVPDGVVGAAYVPTQLASSIGSSGFWSLASGALPPGMFLGSDGVLSGTPTAGGVFAFEVAVSDGFGQEGRRSLTLTIPALQVTTASLPNAPNGVAYPAQQLAAANAYGAATWSVQAGALPPGLTLSGEGLVSGTATAAGAFGFTARVQDAGGSAATRQLSITVAPLTLVTTALPGGQVGIPYAANLVAAGSTPHTWAVTLGTLPAGVTLSASTGALTGTPTTAASSTFTVQVSGSGGTSASRAFTVATTAPADWPQVDRDASGRAWNPGESALNAANVAGLDQEWSLPAALQPVIAGGLVYAAGEVPGRDGTNAVMAIRLDDRELEWVGPSMSPSCGSMPVAVGAEAVVTQCGSLMAFRRAAPHELLWDTAVTDPGIGGTEFRIAGSTVVRWGSDRVVAYSMADGTRLWQQLLPAGATSVLDVAVDGGTVVVAYNDRLRGLSLATGAQAWSRPGVVSGTVVVADGWAYVVEGGGVAQYSTATGTPGWAVRQGSDTYQIVGADNDTVYVWEAFFDFGPANPSVLRALRTSDGSQRWAHSLIDDGPSRIRSVGITSDLVWLTTTEIFSQGRFSRLAALDRATGQVLRAIKYNDNTYGPAAFGNGRVAWSQGGSASNGTPYRLRVFSLAAPLPTITTRVLPTARVGQAYATTLESTGGSGATTWQVVEGTVPAGLSLSPSGSFSGTPSGATSARLRVRVTDARGRTDTVAVTLRVLGTGVNAWPGEGRDPSRDGFNAAETGVGLGSAAQLAFRWRTQVAAGTEAFRAADITPAVVGGRLFSIDRLGRLNAWDTAGNATDRLPLWTHSAAAGLSYYDAPVEAAGTLYLVDSGSFLEAVTASDGTQVWRRAIPSSGGYGADLLVAGGKVLRLDMSFDLHAYDAATGVDAWGGATVDLPGGYQRTSPVLASDGVRAFVLADCAVHAVDLADGSVDWSVPVVPGIQGLSCSVGSRGTPMVADGLVLAATNSGSIAVEAATGTVRWRSGTSNGWADGSAVVASGIWVLSNGANDDGNLVALDVQTGDVLWENAGVPGGMGLAAANDLVVGRRGTWLLGFSLITGEQVWDGGNPDGYDGAAAIAGGRIYVTGAQGTRVYGLP